MAEPTIRERSGQLVLDLGALVAAANLEGHSFVAKTVDEWVTGENRFSAVNEVFYVAEFDGEVIGMCGLNVDPYLGDPEVARLRHLYVHPEHRSDGLGAELVGRCLSHARARFTLVRLRAPGTQADKFYDDLGFGRSESEEATHELVPRD